MSWRIECMPSTFKQRKHGSQRGNLGNLGNRRAYAVRSCGS